MTLHIWVVEMNVHGKWQPTVGVALSRDSAREELREWRENNPCDRFRVVKYVREPS